MELITAHIAGDFDALASLVAMKKLYPQAKAVLPGSPEKAVRDFLSLWKDELGLDDEKDIELDSVKKLIVVETRIPSRMGRAKALLGRKDIEIEIYDHHPRTRYDIKGKKDVYRPTGATVTILLDILRKKKIAITPLEATVMALGIYEDTGSLTFQNTTRQDLDAVGYLFSQGASLNVVSNYLRRELTQKQLVFLSALINKTRDYLINGVHIGITEIESDEYIEDFSSLVHKLLDIENFNVIFAFARVDSKIRMVARSHIPHVKVDKIAEAFGGGGHPYAASAIISNMRFNDVVSKLIGLLKARIRPKIFAEDILPRPAKAIAATGLVSEAKRLMDKSGLEALAVFAKKRMAGIITMQDTERAIKKGFGHSSVKGYMKTKFTRISSRTPLYKIQNLIAKDKVGQLPVFKNRKFLGMITRASILKAVHRELSGRKRLINRRKKRLRLPKSIAAKMKRNLPAEIFNILKLAGKIADERGYNAFCVGGFVRDVMLGVSNFDVDIVLENEGLAFAKELADTLSGTLVVHKRFGTATVVTDLRALEARGPESKKEKFKIDIATARTEYYEYPAALPRVSFSSIKQDLYRRDFTINAMAVSLNHKTFGRLIDFFNGQRDLSSKKIRVLHDLSFVEDPTRIFRAVRFEQRYNFSIEPHTESLIKTAVSLDMFGRTQKQRLRDELILILSEDRPKKALRRMHQLHELRFIHPQIKVNTKMFELFDSVYNVCRWYENTIALRPIDSWLIYLFAIIDGISLRETRRLCEKFIFTKGDEKRILSCKRYADKAGRALAARRRLSPSMIYRYLEPLSYEVILFIMAKARSQKAGERITLFLKRYNRVKLTVGGKDIKALGLEPGPRYKKILNKILYDKLDGKIVGGREELEATKRLSKGI